MRMWMVDPKILCKKHLLGEHGELHKFKHTFEKKHKKTGYIINNCIEPQSMERRHEELALELKSRNYNHSSPYQMPDISYLPQNEREYQIDKDKALQDLLDRCEDCRAQYKKEKV